MPHPKNRLKLTGDTHLPDVGLDYRLDDDEPMEPIGAEEPRFYADGYVPSPQEQMTRMPEEMDHPEPPTTMEKVEQKAAQQTRRTPWLAAGAALTFGWLVVRMMRR